jgi:hypothetical protein
MQEKQYCEALLSEDSHKKKRLSQKNEAASFYSGRGWNRISFMQFSEPLFYF